MPTQFEFDQLKTQRMISIQLEKISLELGKLNINLERLFQQKQVELTRQEQDAAIDRGFEADKE